MLSAADKHILSALSEDGRIAWVKLAKKVNLSASACQRRVEAMMAAGIIKGFRVDIDPLATGKTVRAFINVKVERQNRVSADAFRDQICACPEVQACYKLSGSIDYLIKVAVSDISALSHFIDEQLLAQDGVIDASSAIVLDDLPCAYLPV